MRMALGGFACSKNALAALNVLYILVGIILIVVAAYGKAVAYITGISIMSGIIACGVFLLLIAIIGLIGAIKHHQVMLFFYMIILFLLFLIQFAVACACLALNEEQQEALARNGWNNAPDSLKNNAEKMMNCCGFDDKYQDTVYESKSSSEGKSMGHQPCIKIAACCNGSTAHCCVGNSPSVTGGNVSNVACPCKNCWHGYLSGHMSQAVAIAGGIGLFFSFTELAGVVLALKYRNMKDPRANPSAFL